MRQIYNYGEALEMLDGVSSLASPPTDWVNVTSWQSTEKAPSEFFLDLWADTAVSGTDLKLLGAAPEDKAVASDDVDTVDFANNELDINSHAMETGDGPVRISTTGVLPTGLDADTDYWVIDGGANVIQLATSLSNALDGVAVSFSDAGSGTHSVVGASAKRLYWFEHGWLGHDNDGVVTLADMIAYSIKCLHRPNVVAYALTGTIAAAMNASVTPLRVV